MTRSKQPKITTEKGEQTNLKTVQELVSAICQNHVKKIISIINEDVDLICKNVALQWAVTTGNEKIVNYVIQSGADVNENDNKALICASFYGYANIVKILIDKGANVNAQDSKALIYAVENSNVDLLKILVEAKVNVNSNKNAALLKATRNGSTTIARILIDAGADFNDIRVFISAVKNNYPDIVQMLINYGADAHINNEIITDLAIESQSIEMIKILIDAGAKVKGEYIVKAAYNEYTELVRLLINAKADITYQNDKALIIACIRGNELIAKMLIAVGANVNAQKGKALKSAIKHNYINLVEILIESGVYISDNYIEYAYEKGYIQIANMLENARLYQ